MDTKKLHNQTLNRARCDKWKTKMKMIKQMKCSLCDFVMPFHYSNFKRHIERMHPEVIYTTKLIIREDVEVAQD